MIGHLIVLLYFSAFVSGIPAIIYATQIKNIYSAAFLKYYRFLLISAAALVLIDGIRACIVTNIVSLLTHLNHVKHYGILQ